MRIADVADVRGATVLLDLDGTVVAAGREEVDADAREAVTALREAGNRVLIVSNKRAPGRKERLARSLGIEVLSAPYRKPDPRLRAIVKALPAPYVVIGDRWTTDGAFAKLIGARFIKPKRVTRPDDPLLDRALYALDAAVSFVRLLRPQHYVKNLLVFAPLFFVGAADEPAPRLKAIVAFAAFCCVASAGYALNDVIDVAGDRRHPAKRLRPVASGEISAAAALVTVGVLLAAAHAFVRALPDILPAVAAYVVLTAAYSLWLKRVPVVEMMAFGGFYLLRVHAGGEAVGAALSPWLTLTVLFMALFMVASKRYAERAAERSREVLKAYPEPFLNGLVLMSATLMLVTYALYTVLGTARPYAVYSTLFAVFGAMRYLQLLYGGAQAEFPERLVLADRWLLAASVSWALFMAVIFYP